MHVLLSVLSTRTHDDHELSLFSSTSANSTLQWRVYVLPNLYETFKSMCIRSPRCISVYISRYAFIKTDVTFSQEHFHQRILVQKQNSHTKNSSYFHVFSKTALWLIAGTKTTKIKMSQWPKGIYTEAVWSGSESQNEPRKRCFSQSNLTRKRCRKKESLIQQLDGGQNKL